MVQYTGVIWRTGKVFDSSWSRNQPFTTEDRRRPGHQGLGHRAGRPDRGQPGAAGHPARGGLRHGRRVRSAGIKGTDTLVFVVDILAAVG